jgi:integrase
MTETFRPSELLALRWGDFDLDSHTLTVRRTPFSGKLRDFGTTRMSLRTVHLPQGLVNDLWLWKQECPDVSADAFISLKSRKRGGATKNGFIRTDNYRARVLKKLGVESPGAAAHDCDAGPDQEQRQRRARRFGPRQGRHYGKRLHTTDRVRRQADA